MANQQIAIIDYGMGNLHSVASAVRHQAPDADVIVSGDAQAILQADKIIFPGVGAIRDCMQAINASGMDAVVRESAASRPVLAICVGMQALMHRSEENGGVDCLSLFEGEVKRFIPTEPSFKVPHMGWSQVHQTIDHPLWQGIAQDARFYFVHSYYVKAVNKDNVAATCDYIHAFDAALYRDNVFAVQFHPEKSHDAGLQLLKNFTQWTGQ